MKFSELSVGTKFWTERYGRPHPVKKINEEEVWDERDDMSFGVKPDLEVTEVDIIYPAEFVDTPDGYPPEGVFDEDLVKDIEKAIDEFRDGNSRNVEDIIKELENEQEETKEED